MLTLIGIRAIPSQIFKVLIEQGTINFKLEFKPAIQMWMIDIIFRTFIVYSIRVCNSPNLLEQFSKLIPFGLMCSIEETNRGYEPSSIDDFSSERITLNVLDQTELNQIENIYRELKI